MKVVELMSRTALHLKKVRWALMLRHLGYSTRLDIAVDKVLKEGTTLTPDLKGKSTTQEVLDAVLKKL